MAKTFNYIKHYIEHYAINGERGSGMGLGDKPETLKRAGYVDEMTLLDYGCGCGFILEGINPKNYIGVDIVPWAVETARKKFPKRKFEVLEIGKLKTTKKDFAIALSVFTHTPQELVKPCLEDICKNVKTGGKVLLDILEGEGQDKHIKRWKKEEFAELLKDFTIKDSFKIDAKNGFIHTFFVLNK